jgi:peptidoglycan L-alanyl-D-glutamate endopeptidase CwlK
MAALLLTRIDTDCLYHPFLIALEEMLRDLHQEGHEFWAISGFRDEGEQMALWTQGRTKPGLVVTNAKALESAHNFGLAVDLCRDMQAKRSGLQPSWHPEDYLVLDRACRMHGLEWGGWWKAKDYPHVQLPGYVTASDLKPLAAAWRAAKGNNYVRLSACWDVIDDAAEPKTPPN